MKTLISCAYNMDNCCVELKFNDGSMIAIDTIAVENEIADNMYQPATFFTLSTLTTRAIGTRVSNTASTIVTATLTLPPASGSECTKHITQEAVSLWHSLLC